MRKPCMWNNPPVVRFAEAHRGGNPPGTPTDPRRCASLHQSVGARQNLRVISASHTAPTTTMAAPTAATLPATAAGDFGLFPAADFRVVDGHCTDCQED